MIHLLTLFFTLNYILVCLFVSLFTTDALSNLEHLIKWIKWLKESCLYPPKLWYFTGNKTSNKNVFLFFNWEILCFSNELIQRDSDSVSGWFRFHIPNNIPVISNRKHGRSGELRADANILMLLTELFLWGKLSMRLKITWETINANKHAHTVKTPSPSWGKHSTSPWVEAE